MSDYPGMVDAIPQIRHALASLDTTLPYTVSEQWPRTSITGNLITVTEITNASTGLTSGQQRRTPCVSWGRWSMMRCWVSASAAPPPSSWTDTIKTADISAKHSDLGARSTNDLCD